jgi:flagellar assembly protein FliH
MAGIIKSGVWHSGANTLTPLSFDFEDISTRADTYLASIRHQAAEILAKAKTQVAAIEADARERGQQAAREQAQRSSQEYLDQRLQSLIPALEQSIAAIQHSRETWLRHWEQNTVRLATSIAERLIRRELTRAPEISLDWIRDALELVTGESRVTLHLNPADMETLGERAGQLMTSMTKIGAASVIADPAIELGGCRVVTDFGSIDQQLSAQLKRIEEDLTGQ